MNQKINLGLLFGGRSCEHEVSVTSATSILQAIDRAKYRVHLIGIDKTGHWRLGDDLATLVHDGSVAAVDRLPQPTSVCEVSLGLHSGSNLEAIGGSAGVLPQLDVIFPVLHGPFGEDGALQGVLEMAGLPYVGCGVAAGAIAMDKVLAKQLFKANDIPQAHYTVSTAARWNADRATEHERIEQLLAYPIFAKPANLGSSVGIGKANNAEELVTCIDHALQFDTKILLEQGLENCHEIECAVLGNEQPKASILGEIIPGAEFYDYQTKYIDDKSRLVVPAPLDAATTKRVQALSIEAFKAIDGRGLARVDFFVHRQTGQITLNEINTMPGFTPISMYPRLWAASGLPYPDLIDRLIELARDNHRAKEHLKRAF